MIEYLTIYETNLIDALSEKNFSLKFYKMKFKQVRTNRRFED